MSMSKNRNGIKQNNYFIIIFGIIKNEMSTFHFVFMFNIKKIIIRTKWKNIINYNNIFITKKC